MVVQQKIKQFTEVVGRRAGVRDAYASKKGRKGDFDENEGCVSRV